MEGGNRTLQGDINFTQERAKGHGTLKCKHLQACVDKQTDISMQFIMHGRFHKPTHTLTQSVPAAVTKMF